MPNHLVVFWSTHATLYGAILLTVCGQPALVAASVNSLLCSIQTLSYQTSIYRYYGDSHPRAHMYPGIFPKPTANAYLYAVRSKTEMCCISNALGFACAVLWQDPAAHMGNNAAESTTVAVHANLDSEGMWRQNSSSCASDNCLGVTARPHTQGNANTQNAQTAKLDVPPCAWHLLMTAIGFCRLHEMFADTTCLPQLLQGGRKQLVGHESCCECVVIGSVLSSTKCDCTATACVLQLQRLSRISLVRMFAGPYQDWHCCLPLPSSHVRRTPMEQNL